jgi:hypothetical protein
MRHATPAIGRDPRQGGRYCFAIGVIPFGNEALGNETLRELTKIDLDQQSDPTGPRSTPISLLPVGGRAHSEGPRLDHGDENIPQAIEIDHIAREGGKWVFAPEKPAASQAGCNGDEIIIKLDPSLLWRKLFLDHGGRLPLRRPVARDFASALR